MRCTQPAVSTRLRASGQALDKREVTRRLTRRPPAVRQGRAYGPGSPYLAACAFSDATQANGLTRKGQSVRRLGAPALLL